MSGGRSPLRAFLAPQGVAVFGATPDPHSPGYALLENLGRGGRVGPVFAVSQEHQEIAGQPCVANLAQAGRRLDLALIVAEGKALLAALEACGTAGVRAAIIYAAVGEALHPLDQTTLLEVLAAAHRAGVRLLGPRAFGLILPHSGINLTPLRTIAPAGPLALVTQSAAVCNNILDWTHGDGYGLSAVFGPGIGGDLGLADVLDYLATDLNSRCILLYLEGVADARHFLSALRAAAAVKPVIALKTARGTASAAIAQIASPIRCGSDEAFDVALRRVGVLRVHTIGDMFAAARALTSPAMPNGSRLAVIANGGGPAIMAVDEIERMQLQLASLSAPTLDRLTALPRADWARDNPVGLSYRAQATDYVEATAACLADPDVDGVLAILVPNDSNEPDEIAKAMIAAFAHPGKPVLACWLGENSVRASRMRFTAANFPVFRTPENAILAFSHMANWVRNQALLRETPAAVSSYVAPDRAAAVAIVANALACGRRRLDPVESKAVLAAFHIPVSAVRAVASANEAMRRAQEFGYPVTLKVERPEQAFGHSLHARRHLRSAPEVAMAWRELIGDAHAPQAMLEPYLEYPNARWLALSIRPDPLFGPVISLCESGIAAEIYKARSLAMPPLNPRLIDEMLEVPHVARLLGPLRKLPAVAHAPLQDLLLRVSELASELPWIAQLEIGAMAVDDCRATVVDVAIELQQADHDPACYPHMAICPYPVQLVSRINLRDGRSVVLRPVRPEDAGPLQTFVRGLSLRSKRLRYLSSLMELPQHVLATTTQIDYGRQLSLLAVDETQDSLPQVIGHAQYSLLPDGKSCDFAIVIADTLAGQGLGRKMMAVLMRSAADHGARSIRGDVAADNESMLGLMESLGFTSYLTDDPDLVEVSSLVPAR